MAKFETSVTGYVNTFCEYIKKQILQGSASASLEDETSMSCGDVECRVMVFERYSAIGSNRVSLNVTVLGEGGHLKVSAITSGGSQAVFFKINTIGEDAFLEKLREAVVRYQG